MDADTVDYNLSGSNLQSLSMKRLLSACSKSKIKPMSTAT